MPHRLTPTSYALLGLLSLRPWSTYELAKQVERSLSWFWPRAERKIYDEAKRLVVAGYATAAKDTVGRRKRTNYSITPAGRAALRAWMGEPSAPPRLESEALVRVFFADAGSLDQLEGTLAQTANMAAERLEVLRSMIAALDDPGYAFAERMHVNALGLRFQLDFYEMTAAWARWARQTIETWKSTTDPGDWDWRPAVREGEPLA